MILTNAFSINMFPGVRERTVKFIPATLEQAKGLIGETKVTGAIGHATTAALVNGLLDVEIEHTRVNVVFGENDDLLVAQYTGPRLPEGATVLPEGAAINFWLVVEVQNA